MRIHLLLLITLINSISTIGFQSKTIFLPHGMSQEMLMKTISEKKAQQNIEIAFDIHKVLVHKMKRAQWQTIWNYSHKSDFFFALFNIPLAMQLGSMALQAIVNFLPWGAAQYKEITSEHLINVLRNADELELAQLFTIIINKQRVDQAMIPILIALKKAGYTLHVASNIGTDIYKKLKEQLEQSGDTIFAYFDHDTHGMEGKTIDYTISTIQKPDIRYYQEYQDTYDPKHEKLIVFIDDKRINITPATMQGFVGIHFKNAEQLYNDLHMLGIL